MNEETTTPSSKRAPAWEPVLEQFTHALGHGFRAEIDVADGERGYWLIWDLNGEQILETYQNGRPWVTRTPWAGAARGAYPSFEAAVDEHLRLIAATGGVQNEALFWGDGDLRNIHLPRWTGEPEHGALEAERLRFA